LLYVNRFLNFGCSPITFSVAEEPKAADGPPYPSATWEGTNCRNIPPVISVPALGRHQQLEPALACIGMVPTLILT
jgi:hypothetical protein